MAHQQNRHLCAKRARLLGPGDDLRPDLARSAHVAAMVAGLVPRHIEVAQPFRPVAAPRTHQDEVARRTVVPGTQTLAGDRVRRTIGIARRQVKHLVDNLAAIAVRLGGNLAKPQRGKGVLHIRRVVLTRLVISRLRVGERGKYRRCLGELMIVVALIGGKPRIIPRHASDRRTVVWGVKTRVGKIGRKARGMRGLGLGRRTLTPLRIRSIQSGLLHGAAPRELLRATGGENPGRPERRRQAQGKQGARQPPQHTPQHRPTAISPSIHAHPSSPRAESFAKEYQRSAMRM